MTHRRTSETALCVVCDNSPVNIAPSGARTDETILNDCVTESPGFADAANGDYRLAADSPCIDAGNNSYVTSETDLDGKARIVNGAVDVGCYESDPIVYRTVSFEDECAIIWVISREDGEAVGELLTPERNGYDFVGWFTADVEGEQISAETVVTADVTYYAHWTPTAYDISYLYTKGAENPNPDTYTIEDEIMFEALEDVCGWSLELWWTGSAMAQRRSRNAAVARS